MTSTAVRPDPRQTIGSPRPEIAITCLRREGWVAQLQRHLEVRLEQLWGEPVKIGRYPMPAGDSPLSEEVFRELAQVKTMASVLSPLIASTVNDRFARRKRKKEVDMPPD